MQTIYGLIYDYGDGSCSICWFRNKDTVDALLDGVDDSEEYCINGGDIQATLTLPADMDLAAAGFEMKD